MNMATKQEVVKEKLEQYLKGSKEEKGIILNQIELVTGFIRKSIIRRFASLQHHDAWKEHARAGARPTYGPVVIAALKDLWELLHCICADRLHPDLAAYISKLQACKEWRHDEEATTLLLRMSLATMKRSILGFGNTKQKDKGLSTTKPSNLKEIIPIRRGPWENPIPGQGEIDTVCHCGPVEQGVFAYTVQYTDVSTLWTLLQAQMSKGQETTRESIEQMQGRLPFPLLWLDPDSGSEFINWHLHGWCQKQTPVIQLTRIRPGKKNDHARIEQKNYTNVREFVGYGRFDHSSDIRILKQLYLVLEQYINFFLPSMKCIKKEKTGKKYKRRYDKAQTAYARVLSHPLVDDCVKEKLTSTYATLSPRTLKRQIDVLSEQLFKNSRSQKR